jgi:predicted nuclease of predicted toxin-antitoxin system
LFIEFYLDEDVDVLVADLIRARGFTAITTRDAGNLHKDDDEQLSYAADNQFVFVTHNRVDFEAARWNTSQTAKRIAVSSSLFGALPRTSCEGCL